MLIKAEEAAGKLGISLPRFYTLARRRAFPEGVIVRFGPRQIRVNECKLDEWVGLGGTDQERDTNPQKAITKTFQGRFEGSNAAPGRPDVDLHGVAKTSAASTADWREGK